MLNHSFKCIFEVKEKCHIEFTVLMHNSETQTRYLKYSGSFRHLSTCSTTSSIVLRAFVHFSFRHFTVPSALSVIARIASCCFSSLESTAQLVVWPFNWHFYRRLWGKVFAELCKDNSINLRGKEKQLLIKPKKERKSGAEERGLIYPISCIFSIFFRRTSSNSLL